MSKANGNHPAAYSKFTKKDIEALGLSRRFRDLFPNLKPVSASQLLLDTLADAQMGYLGSEKAKSERRGLGVFTIGR